MAKAFCLERNQNLLNCRSFDRFVAFNPQVSQANTLYALAGSAQFVNEAYNPFLHPPAI